MLQDTAFKLEQNFIDTTFGDIILEPFEHSIKIENVDNIMKRLDFLPNIEGSVAINKVAGRLQDGGKNYIDTQILIVDPERFEKTSLIKSYLYQGDYLNEKERNGIFMGCLNLKTCSQFADSIPSIDVEVGKTVYATFSSGVKSNITLKGNYKHTFANVENVNLISEETASNIFPSFNKNMADAIMIRTANREIVPQVMKDLSFLGFDAKISDWKEKLAFYSQTVDSFSIIGNLSFLVGVIISAISVYIIIYLNALSKKVQIGIMRAIGIRSKIISLSYTLQGLFFGISGAILGLALTYLMIGYFMINPIYSSIGKLVPQASLNMLGLVAITIIIASTLTGYIASRRIIKQNILKSLSRE
jgi:ABC-type lipoprotein release transport system permease subunit